MTKTELRLALRALGWSQQRAARELGVDARSMRRWVAGDVFVPGPVARALNCELRSQEITKHRIKLIKENEKLKSVQDRWVMQQLIQLKGEKK